MSCERRRRFFRTAVMHGGRGGRRPIGQTRCARRGRSPSQPGAGGLFPGGCGHCWLWTVSRVRAPGSGCAPKATRALAVPQADIEHRAVSRGNAVTLHVGQPVPRVTGDWEHRHRARRPCSTPWGPPPVRDATGAGLGGLASHVDPRCPGRWRWKGSRRVRGPVRTAGHLAIFCVTGGHQGVPTCDPTQPAGDGGVDALSKFPLVPGGIEARENVPWGAPACPGGGLSLSWGGPSLSWVPLCCGHSSVGCPPVGFRGHPGDQAVGPRCCPGHTRSVHASQGTLPRPGLTGPQLRGDCGWNRSLRRAAPAVLGPTVGPLRPHWGVSDFPTS